MKIQRPIGLFVIGCFLLAAGCQTAKPAVGQTVTVGSADDAVSLAILSERDVRLKYGRTFTENPFVAPAPSVFPAYNDYIVLQLNFNTRGKVPLVLQRAEVTDDRGKQFATFMTRDKFTDFAMNLSPDQAANTLRRDKIGWYYLPQTSMTLEAGTHSYLLVMVGAHPIPDTATIHVEVTINGIDRDFDMPVPVSNP